MCGTTLQGGVGERQRKILVTVKLSDIQENLARIAGWSDVSREYAVVRNGSAREKVGSYGRCMWDCSARDHAYGGPLYLLLILQMLGLTDGNHVSYDRCGPDVPSVQFEVRAVGPRQRQIRFVRVQSIL
jgi:hypothetical protein